MRIYVPRLTPSDFIEMKLRDLDLSAPKEMLLFNLRELAMTRVPWACSKGLGKYSKKRNSFDYGNWKTKKEFKECVLCSSKKNIHRHHIIPLSMGGINMNLNLVALCSACHASVHQSDGCEKKEIKFEKKVILRKAKVKRSK